MAGSLQRISISGNNLVLIVDNGQRIFCYPTPHNVFIPRTPVTIAEGDDSSSGGDGDIQVGDIPETLRVTETNGGSYNLNKVQLTHAAGIIRAAADIDRVDRKAILIALITSLAESVLYMYSNVSHYPQSANYPHDRDGSDSDSLGLFQQRPTAGWGSVDKLMDEKYSTQAFIGGPDGPNHGNPPGLFDIDGWSGMTPGQAAQKVQGSAFPSRYDPYVPVAQAIMDALIVSKPGGNGDSGDWQWPFQYSQFVLSDPRAQFGMRVNPVTGVYTLHRGLDFGAGGINGRDVKAAHAGTVTVPPKDARGNNVSIAHGNGWETHYFHMQDNSIVVQTGDTVEAGAKLGKVGSTGNSTGAHLHWETIENGEAVNPRDFMKARGNPES